jgi:hypothetical protein
VHDFRGTAWLGLFQGGGWSLWGGMIGKVEGHTATLELYGKGVERLYPGLLGITHYSKRKEERTYEFFLLKREHGAASATVLKKWVIQPEEIKWFVPDNVLQGPLGGDEQHRRLNETEDVRGFLKYFPGIQEAEVTITGLTHPFVEHVKVEFN